MADELVEREVAAEQAFVDRVYTQLEAAGVAAQELAHEGHSRGKMGHEGGLVERDAMVFQAAKRIAQLDAAHEGLVFGRLDLDPSIDALPRYIGRIGVRNAEALAKEGHGRGRLGHEGGLVERDAMVFQAAKRLATLNAAHEGLVFGRLDMRDEVDPEPRYIGRIGLRDADRDSLLIDWRAPAAVAW